MSGLAFRRSVMFPSSGWLNHLNTASSPPTTRRTSPNEDHQLTNNLREHWKFVESSFGLLFYPFLQSAVSSNLTRCYNVEISQFISDILILSYHDWYTTLPSLGISFLRSLRHLLCTCYKVRSCSLGCPYDTKRCVKRHIDTAEPPVKIRWEPPLQDKRRTL